MQRKFIYIGVAVLIMILVLCWLFYESSRPLPGQKQSYECDSYIDLTQLEIKNTDDKCRIHVPIGMEVKYPTNPPTIGPHFADWTRAGVYADVKDDRNLVHSLEHGYVLMFYKCNLESRVESLESSGSAEASGSAQVDTQAICDQRKDQLSAIYEKKGKKKLLVAPKSNLDTNYALSAWQYLDKFNNFEEKRVTDFIDAHLDNGPERTME
jgi:hypothetical protein